MKTSMHAGPRFNTSEKCIQACCVCDVAPIYNAPFANQPKKGLQSYTHETGNDKPVADYNFWRMHGCTALHYILNYRPIYVDDDAYRVDAFAGISPDLCAQPAAACPFCCRLVIKWSTVIVPASQAQEDGA